MRFQDEHENYWTNNQLTVMTAERRPVTQESKVPRISEKTYETAPSEK